MSDYIYICDGCGSEIPELLIDDIEGFRHHTVGEKNPEPCGPIRKVLVIKSFPMRDAFPKESSNARA